MVTNMLERVTNINLNSNLKKSEGRFKKDSYLKSVIHNYQEHDALDFSKGLRELNNNNIKLNKFKKVENRIIISFVYADIEFNTSISTESFSNYIQMSYELRASTQPMFSISISTKTILEESEGVTPSVKSIKFLLSRVGDLDIKSELNIMNTRALSNLFDNIYNSVLKEFRIINSILTRVVSDVMGMPILSYSEEELGNELILIDKIKPENAIPDSDKQ